MHHFCYSGPHHPVAHHSVTFPCPRRPSATVVALVSGLIFVALLIDAMLRPLAPFDRPLIDAIQTLDGPGLATIFGVLDVLTGSPGAIVAWAVVAVIFLAARWWAAAIAVGLVPLGGVVNELVGTVLVERTRPHDADLLRVSSNFEERSFPSGHATGAVILYGLLFAIADQIPFRPLRLTVRFASAGIVLLVGIERVWEGAHWPSDVLASYALGSVLVIGLITIYRRLEPATRGLPLIHAAAMPHIESLPHAHALTSLVRFEGDRVAKTYAPGLIPRALYWASFQAPFPYIANSAALNAAMHRRNLTAALTEYWYGTPRVARVLSVERTGGRYHLVSERIVGHTPSDPAHAKAFLRDLSARFVEAGLPTWQIDPRQPRSIDNLIETAPGHYVIVDLESGLVSPLATRTTWRQALSRGIFPLFDTVLFDVTRSYLAGETDRVRAAVGEKRLASLRQELDATESSTAAWRASEPRLWSRLLTTLLAVGRPWRWGGQMASAMTSGRGWMQSWLDQSVQTWADEGRLTSAQASKLREQMATPSFQAAVPYLGAHVVLSIPLRFPIGTVIRPFLVLTALLVALARLMTRRIDRDEWRQARDLHSPLVMLMAAMPMVGSFAYLTSRPLRSNRLLVRVMADALGVRLPWHLYERTGLRRWVALPATSLPVMADLTPAPVLAAAQIASPSPVSVGPTVDSVLDEPEAIASLRHAQAAPVASRAAMTSVGLDGGGYHP